MLVNDKASPNWSERWPSKSGAVKTRNSSDEATAASYISHIWQRKLPFFEAPFERLHKTWPTQHPEVQHSHPDATRVQSIFSETNKPASKTYVSIGRQHTTETNSLYRAVQGQFQISKSVPSYELMTISLQFEFSKQLSQDWVRGRS